VPVPRQVNPCLHLTYRTGLSADGSHSPVRANRRFVTAKSAELEPRKWCYPEVMSGIQLPTKLIEPRCLFNVNDTFRHHTVIIRNGEYVMGEVSFQIPPTMPRSFARGSSGDGVRRRPICIHSPAITRDTQTRGEIQCSSYLIRPPTFIISTRHPLGDGIPAPDRSQLRGARSSA